MARRVAVAKKKNGVVDKGSVVGMFRIHVTEDGKIVGDSGWCKNLLTNVGIEKYLCYNVVQAQTANRLTVDWVALGSGTLPASNDTTLNGEVMSSTQRVQVTNNTAYSSRTTSNGSATMYLYATFTAGFLSASSNLSNIGLFNSSSGGTLFCGNTYTSSQCNTNQAVNVTYQLQFG